MTGYSSPAPVVVVGSVNRDYVITVDTAPELGRTIVSSTMHHRLGGAGVQQAVAAARVRESGVVFVGCVGDDADGALLLQELRVEGVDTSEIEIIGWATTGLAIVHVVADERSAITVVPGANLEVPPARVRSALNRRCDEASVVVVQTELRVEVIAAALQAAAAAGARVVLDLVAHLELDKELLACGDPLVVDEQGATAVLGRSVSGPAQALDAARELLHVARAVVVTVGGSGACWAEVSGSGHATAARVERLVDGSGARDALVGVMASRLGDGEPLSAAVGEGARAAAPAVKRSDSSSGPPAAPVGLETPGPAASSPSTGLFRA